MAASSISMRSAILVSVIVGVFKDVGAFSRDLHLCVDGLSPDPSQIDKGSVGPDGELSQP